MRAGKSFLAHQMTDRAATLTYYAMMSLFPALLVGVTLLGLVGQQALVTDATNYLLDHGVDQDTANVVAQGPAEHGQHLGRRARGDAGDLGRAWPSTAPPGAFGASGRALNVIYGADESRGMVRRKLTDLGATLAVIVLFAVVLAAIFLGGQIADDLFGKIGLGSTAASIWSYARWPVALVAATVAYGIVYGMAPDIEPRKIRWITPGAASASCCGSCCRSASRSTSATSRATARPTAPSAAAIVLLLWLYLSANAFLFGAELNAELERSAEGDQASSRASSRSVSSGG